MTWSSGSTPVDTFGGMAYRVGTATGVPVVPAGYAWSSLGSSIQGTGTRPNVQGGYVTAAAIYSQIYGRNASTSAYIPAGIFQADRDTMAGAALSSVQTEPGRSHYSGAYNGPTHFASPLLKKRLITYTDWNSSTEWGYRDGLSTILSNARINWTQTYAGYQAFVSSGFPYDFCQQRMYYNADPAKWKVYGTFDYQDDNGAQSMIAGVDRVMYTDPLPEQETCAAYLSSYYMNRGAFFVPVRAFWSRVATEHPEIAPQPDGHHLGSEYNQGVAAMMFTLLSGRCPVGDQPSDTASTAWKNWYCRKTGYEIAWQYGTLQERVPGLEVLPVSANATAILAGASTTLTARFLYPPTDNVTVTVSVDDSAAATVSPTALTFTPANYNVARTITVTGLSGSASVAAFNVNFTTTSGDAAFNGVTDQWPYSTVRPANGAWSANASGNWSDLSNWSGGVVANGTGNTADFSSCDITADRTVQLDLPLNIGNVIFGDTSTATAAGWMIDNNGNAGNVLTLAGAAPAITVNALAAGSGVTVSAILAGTSGLTKSGPGSLTLSAQNTYTGGTVVSAGTLALAAGGGTGTIRGVLTVNAGASVLSTVGSSFGYSPGVNVNTLNLSSATLTHNSSETLTLSSVTVNLTSGTLQTLVGAFDFFDNGSGNTAINSFASSGTSIVAGSVNLRAGDNDLSGTVFNVADGAARVDLLVAASMGNGVYQGAASMVQKSGAGTLLLSGSNSYSGGTILNLGTLAGSSVSAFGAVDTLITFNTVPGAVNSATLSLAADQAMNSYNLTMGSNRYNIVQLNRATPGTGINDNLGTLSLGSSTMTFNQGANVTGGTASVSIAAVDLSAGNNDRPATLSGDACMRITGTAAIFSNNAISKRLQLDGTRHDNIVSGAIKNGSGTGVLTLIKANTSTWTLSGANSYTGDTSVLAGMLVFTQPTLPTGANVWLNSGGVLSLDFAGTNIVAGLRINSVAQSAGTWGGLASKAVYRTALLNGAGVLNVTSGPIVQPYTSWAAAYGLDATPGQQTAFGADPDADGIANGLDWILGGNPVAGNAAPLWQSGLVSGNFVIAFYRNPASESSSTLKAEWTTNLSGTWNAVTIGATSSGPDANGVTVVVIPNTGGPDAVTVSVPQTNAPGGKLFLRLKATSP